MNVDEGPIRGQFARAYEASVGTDADTPMVRRIGALVGIERQMTAVVSVSLHGGGSWTRTFGVHHDRSPLALFTTPHPDVLALRLRGVMIFPVADVLSDPARNHQYLASETHLYGFDGVRILRTSPQVAYGHISGLKLSDGRIHGCGDLLDRQMPAFAFSIDAATGGDARGLPEDFV